MSTIITKNEPLTKIERERLAKLSARLRNMINNEMVSEAGRQLMREVGFDLAYVADKIDDNLHG